MRYVIIGNSAAAVGCIESIRQYDQEGEIIVIAKEPYHTYSRPLISYWLKGKVKEANMVYRNTDFYKQMNCQTKLGVAVTNVIEKENKLVLENGETISYDKLLIATGSTAFIPPIEGLDKVENCFSFMSLDDAKKIDNVITNESNVLIIGAGLIGLKCAEGILHRAKAVTVVDVATNVLSSILDKQSGKMVGEHIKKQGINLHLEKKVEKIENGYAILNTGEKLAFDIIVVAVGVRPNINFLSDTNIEVSRAVVIDDYCSTSVSNIYAAGDCTESYDITTGDRKILALLPNAYRQGECAGTNMAGGCKKYDKAMPMNAISFFGMHLMSAGSYDGIEEVIETDNKYKKLVWKDNKLKGYILVNMVEKAGIYTSLIREEIPLDSIDFEMMKQSPALMAFPPLERAKKLGGVL